MNFNGKDIISIVDMSRQEIDHILEVAQMIEKMPRNEQLKILPGRILALLFFEPSTRTRLSFDTAFNMLGGRTMGLSDVEVSSIKKGETLHDTIKTVEQYADAIVLRHNHDGAARLAADAACVPVINAGDGSNQHPTQTLLDLYTIKKIRGSIDNFDIALIGDLKYGRTVHSLVTALKMYNNIKMFFVSPPNLKMPEYILRELDEHKVKYSEHESMEEIVSLIDILYMTRIQQERFPDPAEYEKVKESYILNNTVLYKARKNLKVLHPLPRVVEIDKEVDDTPFAYYFQQARNGVPARQAILSLVLGGIN